MAFDREQVALTLQNFAETPDGAKVIGYLLEYCHVFQNSMPEDFNTNLTLYNEGQRSVGNELVSLLVNEPYRFRILKSIAELSEGNDIA